MAQEYTVQPGDTLSSIARQFCGDPGQAQHIYELNKQTIGRDPDYIKAGQELTIICCNTSPQQISFSPGSAAATVTGVLSSACPEINYSFKARANQLMVLVLTSSGPTRCSITFPNGNRTDALGTVGVIFEETLSSNGNYSLRLTEDSANPWAGPLTLTVVLQDL